MSEHSVITLERVQFLPYADQLFDVVGDRIYYEVSENRATVSASTSDKHDTSDKQSMQMITTRIPTQATTLSACYDLYAAYSGSITETIDIPAHSRMIFATGIKISFPANSNKYAKIETRSSMAKLGIQALGGVIDADYRGEIKVILQNHNPYPVSVTMWDAIAQIGIYKRYKVDNTLIPCNMIKSMHEAPGKFIEIQNTRDAIRGEGGFGSTNKN